MSDLFNAGPTAAEETAERRAQRTPERCPVCGKMAEYIERFECGRFMASHGPVSKLIDVMGTPGKLLIQSAVVCHGFERGPANVG